MPEGAQITFHEAKSSAGSSDLYNTLRGACNEELSILILGQTNTTTATPGKLGGDDAHEQTENDINQDDREDELGVLNELVRPILANLGYPVRGGRFVHQEEDEKLTTADRVEMFVKLKGYGLPIADDHVYEVTGIPKPNDYDAQKAAQEEARVAATAAQQRPNADGGRGLPAGQKPAPKTAVKAKGPESTQTSVDAKAEALSWWDKQRQKLADFFDPAPEL